MTFFNPSAFQAALGFTGGYQSSEAKKKEDEIKQGGNYIQASFSQTYQIMQLTSVTSPIIEQISNIWIKMTLKMFNFIVPAASVVICPTAALIKQDHYELGVQAYNKLTEQRKFLHNRLPTSLHPQTKKIYSFFSENAGNIAQAGMVAGSIALAVFGSPYFAGAMLAQLGYRYLDNQGYVPRKVSLTIEQKLPFLADVCSLIGGAGLLKVVSGLNLMTSNATVQQFFQKKIDAYTAHKFKLEGPTLEDLDKEVLLIKNPSYQQITALLNKDLEEFISDFEINPAYCSKEVSVATLPEEKDLSQFLRFFSKINWKERTHLLKNKFKDDERFNQYLTDEFCEQIEKPTFEESLKILAEKNHQAVSDFLAFQLDKQMNQFVLTLTGQIRCKGSQEDLDETIKNCSKILFFIQNLDFDKDFIQIEDILLKLAIECGEYCARGTKRASREIIHSILRQSLEIFTKDFNEIENYEIKIHQSLLLLRQAITENQYLKFMETVIVSSKNQGEFTYISAEKQTTDRHTLAMAQDVHVSDLYRKTFAQGFLPLTAEERRNFTIADLNLWSNPAYPFRQQRQVMYKQFYQRIDEIFKDIGDIYFSNYLRMKILENSQLSETEKEMLLNRFIGVSDEVEDLTILHKKFKFFILYVLGVIKLKEEAQLFSDWTEIPSENEFLVVENFEG